MAPPIKVIPVANEDNDYLNARNYADRLGGVNPKQTVFLFPSNDGHHTPATTLFSYKKGDKLAKVAQDLSGNVPTLGLPTMSYTAGVNVNGPNDPVVQQAFRDIGKAAGFGLNIAIPVKAPGSPSGGNLQPVVAGKEPCWWGGVAGQVPPAQQALVRSYEQFFQNLNTLGDPAASPQAKDAAWAALPQEFRDGYQEGLDAQAKARAGQYKGDFFSTSAEMLAQHAALKPGSPQPQPGSPQPAPQQPPAPTQPTPQQPAPTPVQPADKTGAVQGTKQSVENAKQAVDHLQAKFATADAAAQTKLTNDLIEAARLYALEHYLALKRDMVYNEPEDKAFQAFVKKQEDVVNDAQAQPAQKAAAKAILDGLKKGQEEANKPRDLASDEIRFTVGQTKKGKPCVQIDGQNIEAVREFLKNKYGDKFQVKIVDGKEKWKVPPEMPMEKLLEEMNQHLTTKKQLKVEMPTPKEMQKLASMPRPVPKKEEVKKEEEQPTPPPAPQEPPRRPGM